MKFLLLFFCIFFTACISPKFSPFSDEDHLTKTDRYFQRKHDETKLTHLQKEVKKKRNLY